MIDVTIDFSIQKVDKIFRIVHMVGRLYMIVAFTGLISIWVFLNLKLKKLRKEVKIYERCHTDLD